MDLIRYALILREVVTAKRTSQGVKATYKIVVNRKECLPQVATSWLQVISLLGIENEKLQLKRNLYITKNY